MQHTPPSGLSLADSFLARQCGPALILDTVGALVDANPPASQLLAARPVPGGLTVLDQLRTHTGLSPACSPGDLPASNSVTIEHADALRTFHCFTLPLFAADGRWAGTLLHLQEQLESSISGCSSAQVAPRQTLSTDIDKQIQLVLDATCANAWDWDLATGAVHFSDQWLASLGYTRDEISPTAEFRRSIVHPDDWPRVEAALNSYFAGMTPIYECENRLLTRSGEYRPNLYQGKAVAWDANGLPLRMVGVDFDLTTMLALRAERTAVLQRLVMATAIAGIGIWELDGASRTFTWNDQMYTIYGIAPGESITEAQWLATIHPDDLAGLQAQRHVTLTTGQPTTTEFRIRRPDGTIRDTHGIRGPKYDEAGRITGMVGVCIDITERVRLEDELQAREAMLAAMLENADDYTYAVDTAYGYLLGNRRLRDAVKVAFGREFVVGESVLNAPVSQAARDQQQQNLDRALAGESFAVELLVGSSPTAQYAEFRYGPIFGDAGKVVGVVVTGHDITPRKHLELTLAASEEKFRTLFERAGDGIIIVDATGRYVDVNDRYCAMLGRTKHEIIGAHPEDTAVGVTPEFSASVSAKLDAAGVATFERQLRHKDGSFPAVEVTVAPLSGGRRMAIVRDISERRAAERERIFLGALVESSPDAIIGREVDGTIRSWNRGAEQLFGYTADEAIGKTLTMLSAPGGVELMQQVLEQVTRGIPIQGIETQRSAKDGRILDCLISAFPVRDAEDNIMGIAAFATDISDRKRAEAALRQSEARFATAFQANPAAVCITRQVDGCYLDANPAYVAMVGYSREELLGRSPIELGIISAAHNAELVEMARTQGHGRNLETRITAKDGRRIDTISSSEPIERDGEECRLIAAIDVTERLEAQKQLRDSLERLRLATEAAGVGIWAWNFVDGSLDWDERMCTMYGVSHALSGPKPSYDVWRSRVHPEDLAIAEPEHGVVSQFSPLWHTTYRIVLPDGEVRHIFASCIVEYDERGEPVRMIGVNRDVTQQKRYEELLQNTNAELERRVAARTAELQEAIAELRRANSAKDAFLATVSHELRTPMTGIIGMAEVLESQARGPLNEQQMHYLATLHTSAERLLDMINDVLGYASAVSDNTPPVRETCRVAELCAISIRRARLKAAKKQQTIELYIEPFDLTILCDSDMVIKILDTLLDNAVKFTPAHGRIGVVVSARGDTASLTIWDTGIGISEQQLPLLFQPLTQVDWRLSRQYGGIGLGLAYVHRMVEMLGGTIDVESTAGQGSRFTVTLPCRM